MRSLHNGTTGQSTCQHIHTHTSTSGACILPALSKLNCYLPTKLPVANARIMTPICLYSKNGPHAHKSQQTCASYVAHARLCMSCAGHPATARAHTHTQTKKRRRLRWSIDRAAGARACASNRVNAQCCGTTSRHSDSAEWPFYGD